MGIRQTLLIVEDSADDEMLSLRAIKDCGISCEIQVVRHGGDALSLLLAPDGPTPDLLVLDFHLPGYNGIEILRELRKIDRLRRVPIVILSSLDSDAHIARCLELGARSCVQKATDPKVYSERVMLIVKYWLTVDKRPSEE